MTESPQVGDVISAMVPLRGWRRFWARLRGRPLSERHTYAVQHCATSQLGPLHFENCYVEGTALAVTPWGGWNARGHPYVSDPYSGFPSPAAGMINAQLFVDYENALKPPSS